MVAVTVGVGLVVDDAIVVLENVVRHMEMGKPRLQAAVEGGREIAFTILSMTLSLAAVFLPVMFMSGIVGRLFHEFAVVIIVAILTAGLVSLSLTPMLCSRFLKPPSEDHNALYMAFERFFDGMRDVYGWTLRRVVRYRFVTLLGAAATLVVTVYLYGLVPKGFIPAQDQGYISGQAEFPQDASFESMLDSQHKALDVVLANPNVDHATVFAYGPSSIGRIGIRLKPRSERNLSPEQVIEQLLPQFNAIPGARQYMTNPPLVRIGSQNSRSLYQFTLQATDLDSLYRAAADFEKRMRQVPGLTDVSSDLQVASPQLVLGIDRNRASLVGVNAEKVEDVLYSAFGQRQVSTIFRPNNDYQVIMELLPEYQRDPNSINLLYIHSSSGKLIPITAVTTPRNTVGPLQVAHYGQLPSVTFSFNTVPGASLGDAVIRIIDPAREAL